MLVASWGTPSKCAVRFATIMRSISKRPYRRAHCIRTLLPLHRFTAFDFDSQRYSLTILDGGVFARSRSHGPHSSCCSFFMFFFTPLANTHTISADDLTRRHHRAAPQLEAVNWGLPAVNYDLRSALGALGMAGLHRGLGTTPRRCAPGRRDLSTGSQNWSILAIICPRQHQRRRS